MSFVAGNNISISTNTTTKTITIDSSGTATDQFARDAANSAGSYDLTGSLSATSFTGSLCFEILGVLDTLFEATFIVSGYYDDCGCQDRTPRSANTETVICVICSGETSTVTPPHAVYTDAQGIAVTQMNTVVLGGPDGLNS